MVHGRDMWCPLSLSDLVYMSHTSTLLRGTGSKSPENMGQMWQWSLGLPIAPQVLSWKREGSPASAVALEDSIPSALSLGPSECTWGPTSEETLLLTLQRSWSHYPCPGTLGSGNQVWMEPEKRPLSLVWLLKTPTCCFPHKIPLVVANLRAPPPTRDSSQCCFLQPCSMMS